ncbi:MAG: tetratricopeptide repeat protein [Acaryochloridaceae cyanobacterium SU_2_1]|nr:tetratricopeptide repeat protein [Acaryochloridaceae cyanobacterium SU_2_1]NJM95437.1 tetratricopeptide repeat protein [Acaryochloridaceae cyanobacterium CSU_5_19]
MNIRSIIGLVTAKRRLGSMSGFSIYADSTCLVSILIWSVYLGHVSHEFNPSLGRTLGFCVGLLLPISVLIHEVARGFTARHYQISVEAVYCRGMGAFTRLKGKVANPWQMVEVYGAGSLANFILFAVFNLLSTLPFQWGGTLLATIHHLKQFNLVLAIFSLTPLLPLNGGYLLKAIRWQLTGQLAKPAQHELYGGYIAGLVAIILGFFWQAQAPFLAIWLFYLGIMTCLRELLFAGRWLPNPMEEFSATESGIRSSRSKLRVLSQSPRSASPKSNTIRAADFHYLAADFLWCPEPDAEIKKAMAAIQEMKLQAAIAVFDQILQTNPKDFAALHNRGNAYLQLGQPAPALTDFQGALRLKPHNAETYLGKGNAYFALCDYLGAIINYGEVLKINSSHAHAYFNRASALVLNGSRTDAIADYQQAHTLFSQQLDQTQTCKIDRRLQILSPPA